MPVPCDASAAAILRRLRSAARLCVLPLLPTHHDPDSSKEFSGAGGALVVHPIYDGEDGSTAKGADAPAPVYFFPLPEWTELTISSLTLVAQLGSLLRDASIQVVRGCAVTLDQPSAIAIIALAWARFSG
jgi:hypothetical protein